MGWDGLCCGMRIVSMSPKWVVSGERRSGMGLRLWLVSRLGWLVRGCGWIELLFFDSFFQLRFRVLVLLWSFVCVFFFLVGCLDCSGIYLVAVG